jgi:hypothetical protein
VLPALLDRTAGVLTAADPGELPSGPNIWEFAPKIYPEISSLILRYTKISPHTNKSKDMYYGYERISLNGYHHGYQRISL